MKIKEKHTDIIGSTIGVVAKHGFHGTSTKMIADFAGICVGTIYLYFESKDQLMQEVFQELERRCLAAVMKGFPLQGSIRQRFTHMQHALMRHYMLFPEEFLFMDQFLCSPYRKSGSPDILINAEFSSIIQIFLEGMEKQLLKEMPLAMLIALASGPAIQVLRANMAGILYLDDNRISDAAQACWEAVSLQKTAYVRRQQPFQKHDARLTY
jgi:AcrR family transcriptional regulator